MSVVWVIRMGRNTRPGIARTKGIVSTLSAILAFAAFSPAQTKPTLTKARGTKVRLAYKGRAALVDLDNTDHITLGGQGWHKYRMYFSAAKNDRVYFLFQEQGGSPMSDSQGPCGADQPQTLIWLKTDSKMKVEEAKSEVFSSCAYNGGRYQKGKTRIVTDRLKILFEQQGQRYEITYDNNLPENSFAVSGGKK
jgi:hypothetical protein